MQVLVKLVATDVAGQAGESAEAIFRLPERRFVNATAMEIVKIRKHVIFDDAPRFRLALELFNISSNPQVFGDDLSVFLALKAAATELRRASHHDDDATADIEDLLWNAALKIEDGNRPQAEKDLRAAEEALEKALKDPNTPASDIARLTQNLKDAMNRDLQAMAENLRKQMESGQKPDDIDPNTPTIDQHELNDQVDKMNQMAQAGSRDAAQDMLDYIKSLLENMKAGSGKGNEQGKKSLQDLKDLSKKQRDMENGNGPKAAEQQEALRKSLGESARQIGEAMGNIPQALSEADKAMRNATKALQRGTKGGAQGDQENAADKLDEAAKDLSDQLSQRGNETIMKGEGEGNRDPLGRARFDTGRSVHVPTDREMQRSREILDELRKRASEHERPRQELDYLQRLLQQY
jgi:tetratricopeptide (TPR) repeat protein